MEFNGFIAEILAVLSSWKQSLLDILPNLLGAFAVVLAGILLAYVAKRIVVRLLERVHLLVPKPSIRNRIKGFIQEKPVSKIIGGILFWLLILLFLTAATAIVGLPLVSTWLGVITSFMPKVLTVALIVMVGVLAAAVLRDIVATGAISAGVAHGKLLGQLVRAVIILVTVFVAFDQIGLDISFLQSVFTVGIAALLFGAALAFGLGARRSVGNILASYYLQRNYQVGDEVRIGERQGTIIEIGPVSVILDSPEGRVCIPSQEFSRISSVLISKE
jgi:small-conductance mechanosensitive channel